MKKNNFILFLPFIVLLSLMVIFGFDISKKIQTGNLNFTLNSVLIGKPVPSETNLEELNGFEKMTINDLYLNEIKLVNFWASWCAPCRAEHALLMQLSDEGYKIYGINYKDKENNSIKFLKSLGNPYHKLGRDENGKTAIDWGLYGVPETFLVNEKGKIIHRHAGPLTRDIFEKDFLQKLSK